MKVTVLYRIPEQHPVIKKLTDVFPPSVLASNYTSNLVKSAVA